MAEQSTEQLEAHCGKLWDSQWVNVVSHDDCYRDWDKADAARGGEVMEAMTLEQISDILRSSVIRGHDSIAMADAIDAHLAQPAQAVDVGDQDE